MHVHYFTHDHKGNNTAKAYTANHSEGAIITISDGISSVQIFGPLEAAEAFTEMARLFNEAHHPKPKEIEHLGTVALDEPTNT